MYNVSPLSLLLFNYKWQWWGGGEQPYCNWIADCWNKIPCQELSFNISWDSVPETKWQGVIEDSNVKGSRKWRYTIHHLEVGGVFCSEKWVSPQNNSSVITCSTSTPLLALLTAIVVEKYASPYFNLSVHGPWKLCR